MKANHNPKQDIGVEENFSHASFSSIDSAGCQRFFCSVISVLALFCPPAFL